MTWPAMQLTIAGLASRAKMTRRTFIRWFRTGNRPGARRMVVQARVLRAWQLLEATKMATEDVASATGFGSADALRHHFRKRLGTRLVRYRAIFQTSGPPQSNSPRRPPSPPRPRFSPA
ncbi:helix-turn-helix domain-containing protein [Bradyrhizobium sp. STM 3562]|uniref:helix-turn-helix domain-containing protein n=1 Tax=Bradyrhizobium sp. STM 3562 TaxID=578924 RepID=UPI00388E306E